MSLDMSEMLGIFLEEAEEQLLRLDDGLLQLEKDPTNNETIKEVFRAAHTLKGSSATMGLTEIASLTHAMENLLDLYRSGALEATPETIDLLLNGTDALRTFIGQVTRNEPMDADVSELLSLLKAASTGATTAPAPVSELQTAVTNKPLITGGPNSMTLRMKVVDDCLMPAVRAFMIYNALSDLGEIESSDPPQEAIDDIQQGQEITIVFVPSQGHEAVVKAMSSLSEIDMLDYVLAGEQQDTPAPMPSADAAIAATGTVQPSVVAESKPKSDKPETATRPIQTVRVGVDRLDTLMNLVAELVIDRTRVSQIEGKLSLKYENEDLIKGLGETAAHIGRVVNELQEHIMKVRLLPVEQVFSRFPRMVRDLSYKAGKEIEFVMEGQETELDRSILEEIVDPITHLLRNSVDHGVELPDDREAAGRPRQARVVLAAKQEENRIIIEVSDDGKGINVEKVKQAALRNGTTTEEQLSRMTEVDCLQLIFASGVSTAEKITDVSGRGVGMDVVRSNIQALSGSVEVQTETGVGTKFRISLPLTLAIIQALVTGVDDRVFVIPLGAVVETFRCDVADIRHIDGHPAINFRGIVLPLVELRSLFPTYRNFVRQDYKTSTFVIINTGATKIGLVVDKLIGEQEVVIKPLGQFFGNLNGVAGATILGDGQVALIVDVSGIGALLNRRRQEREKERRSLAEAV